MKPNNPELIKVTRLLKSKSTELHTPIWNALAERLEISKHNRCAVNVSRINRYSVDGDVVTVPGKVLGVGTLDHKVSIAAFMFSKVATRKIEAAGGKCLTFSDLVRNNPTGSNLKIIG